MGYKLGLLLSMLFLAQLFVLTGDIISIQVIYTNLDAVSVVAGNLISSRGKIDAYIEGLVSDQTGGYIEAVGDEAPRFGSVYEFRLIREYTPWVMSNEPIEITIKRSVVIGYYS